MKEERLHAKEAIVEDIKEKFEQAKSIVLLDYRGLTVEQVTLLRDQMRSAGIEYKVIKNTMLTRAANELGIPGTEELFKGPTAVAFGLTDAAAPAKILVEFIKKVKKTEIKGGLLEGKVMDLDQIKYLAELPPREVLLAKLLGTLNAPASNLVGVLSGLPRALVCALNAIKEQKEA
ncbi:MAG: 50S ribosomal protein L10 [Eubacteriales bacterium]